MKGCNKTLKKLKNLLIIISIILICSVTHIYATDVEVGDSDSKTEATNLPYIEMKVKFKSNQVLVEMWGANFTNLEGMEIVFTYNNAKLTPSIVSSNEAIDNLDEIKYDKRPTNYKNAQTDFEKAERDEFNSKSKETLSNSFAFDNNALGIDTFLYLEPNENIEAMQFIISRKDYLQDINATDPILLGKFSFKQSEGTTIEETDFATKRIKIYCDDGATEDDYSYYVREEANGENCTDIVEFTYEKYGSIRGTVDASIEKVDGSRFSSKNIASIKLYKKEDVEAMDWTQTGNSYATARNELIEEPYRTYQINADDNGNFIMDKIEFGEYVMLIDKDYYSDFIITNIVISSENKDINFLDIELIGVINLIPGDVNKDGKIDSNDTLAYNKDFKGEKNIDLDDASGRNGKNTSQDTLIYNRAYNLYGKDRKKQVVKKVVNL